MLEFALVLPVLLILCAGCVELGRALFAYSVVETALRGGTRYLAQVPTPACRPDCSWGAERAIAMTRSQIEANTGIAPELVRVWAPNDAAAGTVLLRAQVVITLKVLGGFGHVGVWTVDVSRQEQRIAG